MQNRMSFDVQQTLENEKVILIPLTEDDFEALYTVASDPDIWAQHPNKSRWKREVFHTFFQGALHSKGAYKVVDRTTGTVIGSTRFYDPQPDSDSVLIGYTFYAKDYWGKGFNRAAKTLMLNYAFRFVSQVLFHVGAINLRSQIAIERLGATKIGAQEIEYFGETPKLNYVYSLKRDEWIQQ